MIDFKLHFYAILTRLECDFADHDPARGEMQLQFDEAADAVVQFDGDVPRVLEDTVLHIAVRDWLSGVDLAAHTEHDLGLGEHLLA